ncbi:MAG: cyclic nucleotide-binding domain-containing protein [Chloroflexota bacterium]
MRNGGLGEMFRDGDTIIRQGDVGSSMYVIEDGEVEVVHLHDGKAVRLAVLSRGEIFGELSLFGNDARSATVRALGDVHVTAVDRSTFLRRIQGDVSLAFQTFQNMATRLDHMNAELAVLEGAASFAV